jgi:hypothetical protein
MSDTEYSRYIPQSRAPILCGISAARFEISSELRWLSHRAPCVANDSPGAQWLAYRGQGRSAGPSPRRARSSLRACRSSSSSGPDGREAPARSGCRSQTPAGASRTSAGMCGSSPACSTSPQRRLSGPRAAAPIHGRGDVAAPRYTGLATASWLRIATATTRSLTQDSRGKPGRRGASLARRGAAAVACYSKVSQRSQRRCIDARASRRVLGQAPSRAKQNQAFSRSRPEASPRTSPPPDRQRESCAVPPGASSAPGGGSQAAS